MPEPAFNFDTDIEDPFIDEDSEVLPNGNSRVKGSGGVSLELHQGNPADLTKLGQRKQRTAPISHNSRSRTYWERQGYVYCHCEGQEIVTKYVGGHVSAFPGRKFDLLGLFDAIAMKQGEPLIGIQTTSTSGLSSHLRSMCGLDLDRRSGRRNVDNLRLWLSMGFRAVILQWDERQKVGSQKYFAVLHEVNFETIEGVEKRRRVRE